MALALVTAACEASRTRDGDGLAGRDGAASSGLNGGAEASAPEVTPQQAAAAVSDAMLVTSQALYLAIANGADASSEREIASEDGRLVLRWSEDASFFTGAGTYELTLDDYAIPADDQFAPHYHGYAWTGTIRLASRTGQRTDLGFTLRAAHADPRAYPVETLELDLSGFSESDEDDASGSVRANGRELTFAELAGSF